MSILITILLFDFLKLSVKSMKNQSKRKRSSCYFFTLLKKVTKKASSCAS